MFISPRTSPIDIPRNAAVSTADASHCHKPDCSWLALHNLTSLQHVPPLLPNPELSGVGVILGFSITAYLTVALLIFHYLTVYDPRRVGSTGREYINPVDRGILAFVRRWLVAWSPSRRFAYSMEKSVLILSDAQLVTGLAILIAGYSQLNCGISAYHWQIMVFVAWFSSFTFLSAMAFLEDYFQTNNSMRIIRVCFMCVLAGLLIVALLPTGSRNWLDLVGEGGGFYPSLSAECYFKQLTMSSYIGKGPRLWSMVFSVLVVGFSYVHRGIRLFDPTAERSRKYLRTKPGSCVKQALYFLGRRATQRGIGAAPWVVPYLVGVATFSSVRAFYDFTESMLAEIIWLAFAIAWGTIKVWGTRASAQYTFDGHHMAYNTGVLEEDFWSFGQTLPLVLLLLPIFSMGQSYLDNDAKAHEALHDATPPETKERHENTPNQPREAPATAQSDDTPVIYPAPLHPPTSLPESHSQIPSLLSSPPTPAPHLSLLASIPYHPFPPFTTLPWYRDHTSLLILQTLLLGSFILFVQNSLASILGISALLRNRLFLMWIFALIPLGAFIHLALWFLGACVVSCMDGASEWLLGEGKYASRRRRECWKRSTAGPWVYYGLRVLGVVGCVAFTFFLSVELAGPNAVVFDVDPRTAS